MGEPALSLVEGRAAEPVSADDFLQAMRTVVASVTVVTTDGAGGRHGATVSSFTSVSVTPPTILVCLASRSRIARAVRTNGRFAVNVLPSDGEAVARRFSDAEADRFDGLKLDWAGGGLPPLPLIPGATVFLCALDRIETVATHDVCFATVETVCIGDAAPLAYFDRSFAQVVRR